MINRPYQTPKGAVMLETQVMNLVVEPRKLVLATLVALAD